jgi:SAM-dependent methyltransferase
MYSQVKTKWAKASDDLSGSDAFWERSALGLSLLYDLKKELTPEHIKGKLLDAGAGKLPYRHLVKDLCSEYQSIDFQKTHPDLTYVGDVQKMPIGDSLFDTVLCVEVLEHVPDPSAALAEIYRVLKPGGRLVLTIPHLMYMHNEPHDYYRYTKYGLTYLLNKAGFSIITIKPSGGLFSFLQGIVATSVVGLTYDTFMWPLAFELNRLFSWAAIWCDNHTDRKKIFSLHFIAVAQKPAHS